MNLSGIERGASRWAAND